MNRTTATFTTALIAGIILMSLQTASAQEWRMLIDKNIFTKDQVTQTMGKNSGEQNNWLATQSPLIKNTPITGSNMNAFSLKTPRFESEFSQVGSWAPLQSAPGKENFTLFSF